jgi:hypothetical protein
MIIGFGIMGIFTIAAVGALIPLFIGAGLVVYYAVAMRFRAGEPTNDQPIRFDPVQGKPPSIPSRDDE